jgi:hypothetical protein
MMLVVVMNVKLRLISVMSTLLMEPHLIVLSVKETLARVVALVCFPVFFCNTGIVWHL